MLARVPLIEGVRVDIFQVCFSPGLLLLLSQLLGLLLVVVILNMLEYTGLGWVVICDNLSLVNS